MTHKVISNRTLSMGGLVGKSGGAVDVDVPMFLEKWTDIACHSGDCVFDLMFKPLFAETLTRVSKSGVSMNSE